MKFIIFFVLSLNLFAYSLPVCERTQQVQDEIVELTRGKAWFHWLRGEDCYLADNFLEYITRLNLSNKGITSLKAGDFSKLTSLRVLNLSDNQLSTLPVGVFSGLPALKLLHLHNNNLSTLPVGVFLKLPSLKKLVLQDNLFQKNEKRRIEKELPHTQILFY